MIINLSFIVGLQYLQKVVVMPIFLICNFQVFLSL